MKPMSLIKNLNKWIQEKGFVSYQEVEEYCRRNSARKYYMDTARRRLEPDESPNVEVVIENGITKGWKWVGEAKKPIGHYRVEGMNLKIPIFN